MDELRGTLCVISVRIWAETAPPSSSALCGNSTSSLFSHLTPCPRALWLIPLAFIIHQCWRFRCLEIILIHTQCHCPAKFGSAQNLSVHAGWLLCRLVFLQWDLETSPVPSLFSTIHSCPYGPLNHSQDATFLAELMIVEIMEDQGKVCCSSHSYNVVIACGLFYG